MTDIPSNRTPARLVALAAIALLGATALAGCTLRLADPADPSVPPSDPATSGEGADDDSGASDAPEDSAASTRETAIGVAQQTIPCSPGLDVSAAGTVVRVEGDCDALTVSADAAVVVADDVAALTVSGTGTVVYVLQLDDLRLTGDANVVSWTGTTPSVTDTGTANTIGKDI